MIKCGRCGYEYDPTHPEKAVISMVAADGCTYTMCRYCITEFGRAAEEERKEMMERFKNEN